MIRTILLYGVALGVGALALEALHEFLWAGGWPGEIGVAAVALAFLGLGVWVGVRLLRPRSAGGPFA